MSYASHGDSVYYRTDYGYGKRGRGPRPLPFPPQEVWCVLLGREIDSGDDATDTSPSVVFVALHLDMYNADEIIHEAAQDPFSEQYASDLALLGCALGSEH